MKIPLLKKREFRPDRRGTSQLSKLWPTPGQQLRILCWILYGLMCLVVLLMQDVLLYRIDIAGGCTDLVPTLVIMVAVLQGAERGSIFALLASVLYFFSGSSPGFYVIPLLTGVAVLVAIFRQAFLRRGFWTVLVCETLGLGVYELGLFTVNWFLKLTVFSRVGAAFSTVVLSLLAVPVAYPVLMTIGKLGGEAWDE